MTKYTKKTMPSGAYAACKNGRPYAFFVDAVRRDAWIDDQRQNEKRKRCKDEQ